ncbi:MAG TPA: helix-turn-helix transcriptional regulator [Alphaproteobacteria bacterium]|jgi:DNA-binding XRE family transcriptional regulator
MKHDLLHIQGKPYMLVPLHEYRILVNSDNVSKGILSEEILNALAAGQESPVKILRRHRGMTQQELADAANLSRPYLTEIEKGRKPGSVKALRAIAAALSVDIRDLMPKS